MSKLVFTLLFSLMSSLAFASEVHLVKATNDEDNEICDLYLVLDEQKDISGIRIIKTVEGETIDDVYQYLDGKEYSMVISRQQGREVVKMSSSNFSSHNGASLNLIYLYNGFGSTYHGKKLELSRDGDEWKLEMDGKSVSHLHFVSNKKFLVGTVGIKFIKAVK
ncbi:MAG: hypothetical protein CME64_12945 [Halobacteriovoraceae bacterium]|nr:hypothetical protein [Halobacteriovoraceae bacterium]|tara:strand:- start:106729 stop:107220 length:492 start_codon:yes stop_codon:yes gene_type:complete